MGNTGMYVLRAALVLLIACHNSPPSVSHGSGTGSGTAANGAAAPQQNEPQRPGNRPPEPTSTVPPVAPATPVEQSGTGGAAPATGTKPTGAKPPGAGAPPTGNPAPTGRPIEPPPTGATTTGSAADPGIEQPCGPGDHCAPGLTCIAYYGFAGPRGPQFKSCEVRCKDDSGCPTGRTCVTVSDGPGRVCR
jgi:hypothetical protein